MINSIMEYIKHIPLDAYRMGQKSLHQNSKYCGVQIPNSAWKCHAGHECSWPLAHLFDTSKHCLVSALPNTWNLLGGVGHCFAWHVRVNLGFYFNFQIEELVHSGLCAMWHLGHNSIFNFASYCQNMVSPIILSGQQKCFPYLYYFLMTKSLFTFVDLRIIGEIIFWQ
jgi:hypothetical protein